LVLTMKAIVRARAYRILFALFTMASCALILEAGQRWRF
jgi:hypothetical protein